MPFVLSECYIQHHHHKEPRHHAERTRMRVLAEMGFRDQLQDMLALLQVEPARVREQLLLCAGRQFPAGDVLHWWHMPMRGVRTRIVDDRLFLPYVLSYYLETTQDMDILDVPVASILWQNSKWNRKRLLKAISVLASR